MKRVFTIQWPDELGEQWLNPDNILSCFRGGEQVAGSIEIRIEDYTEAVKGFSAASQRITDSVVSMFSEDECSEDFDE